MELLSTLIAEKWLIAAVTFLWAVLERKERLADKAVFRAQREAFIVRLDSVAEALIVVKERLGP